MNKRALKNLLSRKSSVWTLSLCMTGVLALGGIAAVNKVRRITDQELETEIDQLAYLEEELPDGVNSENLFPTVEDMETQQDIKMQEENLAVNADGSTQDNTDLQVSAANADGNTAENKKDGDKTDKENAESVNADIDDENVESVNADINDENVESTNEESAGKNAESANADIFGENAERVEEDINDESARSVSADIEGENAESISTDITSEDIETAASSNVISEQALIDAGIGFGSENSLMWPSAGTILIDYCMDHSVYFQTLNQYKYNPAVIIGGAVGNQVLASAKGIVESIGVDEETGTTLTLNIGDGYRLTYGQLKELAVSEGDIVEKGELIGYVSEPTKYYSEEGSNLYFAMTHDDAAVDPVLYLE